ncbi:MAG: peptidylprolyl isomerase [Gammaproteobacteria bacterium]|nr:peptidylprolyl isomerase [Gammaproteobacteria bacterium]
MKIDAKRVVSIHYQLTNDAGETLDASSEGEPLVYLHGAQNLIPGLEAALDGRGVGDSFKVSVQPEDAYGPRREELVRTLSRDMFKGVDSIEPGMQFQAQGPHGQMQRLVVTAVSDDGVEVDANHPLAGEVLHFEVTIAEVREATDQELSHGHVHADGHDH